MRKAEEILDEAVFGDRPARRTTIVLNAYAHAAIKQAQREAIEAAIEVVRSAIDPDHVEGGLRALLPHREG